MLCAESISREFFTRVRASAGIEQVMHTYKPRLSSHTVPPSPPLFTHNCDCSLHQELSVVSAFAREEAVCQDDVLVLILVDDKNNIAVAKCVRRGCDRSALNQKVKVCGKSANHRHLQCPHVAGIWGFVDGKLSTFKIRKWSRLMRFYSICCVMLLLCRKSIRNVRSDSSQE